MLGFLFSPSCACCDGTESCSLCSGTTEDRNMRVDVSGGNCGHNGYYIAGKNVGCTWGFPFPGAGGYFPIVSVSQSFIVYPDEFEIIVEVKFYFTLFGNITYQKNYGEVSDIDCSAFSSTNIPFVSKTHSCTTPGTLTLTSL